MERDFTEQKLKELKGFLNDETLTMGNDGAHILANHYNWCEKLDIVDHLNYSTTYEQLLRHKYDTTTVALDNIFTEVRDADQSYAKVIATYSDGAAVIKKYIDQLAAIINPNNGSFTVASCAAAFKQLGLDAKTLRDNKKARVEEILAKHAADGTPLTEAEKQFLANYLKVMTAEKKTGNDLKNKNKLTDAERDLLIQLYEALNPENATNMDALFAGMKADGSYSEDIAYIKYISYTAEEPYRSVFFEYAGEMEIGDFNLIERDQNNDDVSQHYNYVDEKLYIRFNGQKGEGLNDPRGPYVTFFHECGHAIDDLSAKDVNKKFLLWEYENKKKFTIWDYTNAEGLDLQQVAYQDINDNLENYINQYVANPANRISLGQIQKDEVISKIFEYNSIGFVVGSAQETVYNAVIKEYHDIFSVPTTMKAIYNGISDVYGGYTDNKLKGSSGHPNDYWIDEKTNEYSKLQSKELWAHGFARFMLSDDVVMKEMEVYLPNSVETMKEICKYIVEN